MQNITLAIDGMSCGHCVAAVRSALAEVDGVSAQQVEVGSATLGIDPAADSPVAVIEASIRAVEDAGYDARVAHQIAAVRAVPSCCGSCCSRD